MNKTSVYIGLMSLVVLASGILVFTQMSEKDEQEMIEASTEVEVEDVKKAEEVEEVEKEVEAEEAEEVENPETDKSLDNLPMADAEAAKWNEAAPEFIAENSDYKMDAANIKKDEANSSEAVTMFFHDFKTQLKTSINYMVDNDTQEITEMKLVGHEIAGADRAAIFYAMSIFISYVDGEVTMDQGGEYLGEIPFATNEVGVYENDFNGKKYEYVLDLDEGTNTLLYRVGE